jgi:hypothetical protein
VETVVLRASMGAISTPAISGPKSVTFITLVCERAFVQPECVDGGLGAWSRLGDAPSDIRAGSGARLGEGGQAGCDVPQVRCVRRTGNDIWSTIYIVGILNRPYR